MLGIYLKKFQGKVFTFIKKTAVVIVFCVLITAVFLIGQNAFAQAPPLPDDLELPQEGNLVDAVVNVINIVIGFLGLIAVIIIIYAGFVYMSSGGDVEKTKKARKILINGFIGLVLIVFSYLIAQWILLLLYGGGIFGGQDPAGPGTAIYGDSALGNGIVESVYPMPNARDIPRNTSIIITFKERMDTASIIDDTNDNGTLGDCDDANGNNNGVLDVIDIDNSECDLISSNVIITANLDTGDEDNQLVLGRVSADGKTFVFKPVNFLGNPITPTDYTVTMQSGAGGIRKSNGEAAFPLNPFAWSFEVSTFLDLTPPKITTVKPRINQQVVRNKIIQIQFDEPVNPLTIGGLVEVGGDGKVGPLNSGTFNLLSVYQDAGYNINDLSQSDDFADADNFVAGEFVFSNMYKTVEFITNDPCGVNSCGKTIFCLPANSNLSVFTKSATFSLLSGGDTEIKVAEYLPGSGYTGVVDMADNPFDGNENNNVEGPQSQSYNPSYYRNEALILNNNPDQYQAYQNNHGDDAKWTFRTNNQIDLEAPQVIDYSPDVEEGDISHPDIHPEVVFSKPMSHYYLSRTGNRYDDDQRWYMMLWQYQEPKIGFISDPQDIYETDLSGNIVYDPITGQKIIKYTKTKLFHTRSLNEFADYEVLAGSGIVDDTQNCYLPCSDSLNEGLFFHCKREDDPGTPGQYLQGSPWQGDYPSCNVSGSGDVFGLTVNNQTYPVGSFGLNQDISSFMNYNDNSANIQDAGGKFAAMLNGNRAVTFTYYSYPNNSYYLITVFGYRYSNTKGNAEFNISGSTNLSVTFKDDQQDSYQTDNDSSNSWSVNEHDAVAVNLGSANILKASGAFTMQLKTLNIFLADDTEVNSQWWFYAPNGEVLISENINVDQPIIKFDFPAEGI